MSSSDGQPGLLATLETILVYPPSQSVCYLRLWYFMHTQLSAENVDIGSLRVYLAGMTYVCIISSLSLMDYQRWIISLGSQCVVLSDKVNKRYLVASVSGNYDDEWVELIILVNMDVEYFVMFEAETGTSEHTYIAIDDVSFTYVSVNKSSNNINK